MNVLAGIVRIVLRRPAVVLLVAIVFLPTLLPAQPSWFRRGDAGGDGRVDVDDALFIVDYLFMGGPTPDCFDAADADDDDDIDNSDQIYILNFSVAGGPLPPDPGPMMCGPDPTPGALDCLSYSCAFIRGDADGNGIVDAADAIAINDFLFMGGVLDCLDAADANDDGVIDNNDPLIILGGVLPPLPGPEVCGPDYVADTLDCQQYTSPPLFLRGDVNGDGLVDGDDALELSAFLFMGGAIACEAAGDANSDGVLNTTDVIYIEAYATGVGPPPLAPFPVCGVDITTPFPCEGKPCIFIRGDADGDGQVDIDDVTAILDHIGGIILLGCLDAGDANDDGVIDVQDSIFVANAVTGVGPLPPAPGPHVCGVDPTADGLDCDDYECLIPNDFVRGDCNADTNFDVSDGVYLLSLLFPPPGGPPVASCRDACDTNDDGTIDIADAIRLLCGVFGCGPLPEQPFPDCGYDPTPIDILGCEDYTQLGCP